MSLERARLAVHVKSDCWSHFGSTVDHSTISTSNHCTYLLMLFCVWMMGGGGKTIFCNDTTFVSNDTTIV